MYTTTSLFTKAGFQVNQNIHWEMLTDDQCEVLLSNAFELLERSGVEVLSKQARDAFEKGGCWVEGERVRIPTAVLERALRTVPSRVTLCGRDGGRAIMMETNNAHYGPCFGAEQAIDVESGEARPAMLSDVTALAKLANGLNNVDFLMGGVRPSDVKAASAAPHVFHALVSNSAKPVVQPVDSVAQAEAVMEIALAVKGSDRAFRSDPFAALLTGTPECMSIGTDASDTVMRAAAKGFPVIFSNNLVTGLTAPKSSAGAIVVALSNSLAALALSQIAAEGAPFITGGFFTLNDERNKMRPYGAPEISLLNAGFAAVLRYLRVPSFGFAGGTDSMISDAQMGLESAFSILHAGLAGTSLIYGAGLVENGGAFSPYLLTISDELMAMTRRIMRGVEMDEDRLARGLIDDVQPGGHYLDTPHTRYYYKNEQFWPALMNRTRIDDWVVAGSKPLGVRAAEKTRELLTFSQARPLDKAVSDKLAGILKSVAA